MTKEERHEVIMELLLRQDRIPVNDLASHLGVSAVTVRKDLAELEHLGKLYRSHGKAIQIDPFIRQRSISEKEKLAAPEKMLIGQVAASMVSNDDSIILGAGSTVEAMARCIQPIGDLTIVTSSIRVSDLMAGLPNVHILQLGGMLRHDARSVIGAYAEGPLADVSCSKLFIGVDGIDPDFGITNTNMGEADLNRVMMQAAQKVIVLADSTKFRHRGFCRISSLEDVDLIITDDGVSPAIINKMESLGVGLLIAKPGSHPLPIQTE